jgi:hypothetical protein
MVAPSVYQVCHAPKNSISRMDTSPGHIIPLLVAINQLFAAIHFKTGIEPLGGKIPAKASTADVI